MSQSLMYQQDHYVVLETNQPEQFLTAVDMKEKLKQVIQTYPDVLDPDVQAIASIDDQAQYLLDNVCELKPEPGQYLQWYAIRLEK